MYKVQCGSLFARCDHATSVEIPWRILWILMVVDSHIAAMRLNKLQHAEALCLSSDYPGVCCGAGTLLELE